MKKYKVILTESEMRKLNEIRRDIRAKRLVVDDGDVEDEDEFITVDHIDKNNYKKYIGRKVNVIRNVSVMGLNLRKLSITFGTVGGDFNCSYNELRTLNGCPKEVGKNFYCGNNNLSSLKDCPHKIGGNFICSYNNLSSLIGCPKDISENFECSSNELNSLAGCPHKVDGNFYCYDNNKKEITKNDIKSVCDVGGDIVNYNPEYI